MKNRKNVFATGYYRSYTKNRNKFARFRAHLIKNARSFNKRTLLAAKNTRKTVQNTVYSSTFIRPTAILALSFLLGLSAGRTFMPINRAEAAQVTDVSGLINTAQITAKTEKESLARAETAPITSAGTSTAISKTAINSNIASVVSKPASTGLYIPSVGISTPVTSSAKSGSQLSVPSYGASIYGSLIMGHVFGVFGNLASTAPGQELYLNGQKYIITSVARNLPVSSDLKSVGGYSMHQLINNGGLVLMTCAGNYSNNLGTYTHRTLVFAQKTA